MSDDSTFLITDAPSYSLSECSQTGVWMRGPKSIVLSIDGIEQKSIESVDLLVYVSTGSSYRKSVESWSTPVLPS